MVEIIPAILPKTFADLHAGLARVRGVAKRVQVDAVDGRFAPNRTWPYGDATSFAAVASGAEGLPFWEDFDFQFDLMVADPGREAPCFAAAGAAGLVVHIGSPGARQALEQLQSLRGGEFGVELGVAIPPAASSESVEPFISLVDIVQVMGIAREGFQEQPLEEQPVFALLAALRAAHPDLPLQVDGGVVLEKVRALVEAGATRLVCGHAVFNTPDAMGALQALYTEANG